jgi:hypothetical protein
MRYVRAEFTAAIFLGLSIDGLRNRRLEELVDIASFFFAGRCISHVIDWLDIYIHQKPFIVDILWIS